MVIRNHTTGGIKSVGLNMNNPVQDMPIGLS